jgi:hypothetical protein
MAEGGVAQIVAQGSRLHQVLVEVQAAGHGTANAGDLKGMGHTGAIVVTLRLEENLGLMLQTAEGLTVHHTIDIPLEAGAHGTGFNLHRSALAVGGQAGSGGKDLTLLLLGIFSKVHTVRLLREISVFKYTLPTTKNPFFSENFYKLFSYPGQGSHRL